jgi:hypothetical protein
MERAGRERAMMVRTREEWKREDGEIGGDWEGAGVNAELGKN